MSSENGPFWLSPSTKSPQWLKCPFSKIKAMVVDNVRNAV